MRLAILAFLAFALQIEGAPAAAPVPSAAVIFAAASTREAMTDAIRRFADTNPEAGTVIGIYDGSSALARRLVRGETAHLFLSANTAWMDAVVGAGRARPEDVLPRLGNELVLVHGIRTRGARIAEGRGLLTALGDGPLAIADPRAVPAGLYARQTLEALGIWDPIRRLLAPTAHVRAALALVTRGDAPYGFVYATDAAATGRVRVTWRVPDGLHEPIVYPLALLDAGRAVPAAVAFHGFLKSPAGAAPFRERGFAVF